MNRLNIFVSSTCYDLSQIRTDLYESISGLGFTPILSEYANFPINPSNNTVENCIEAINTSADVFILILGNRYGYKLESGKSITNMEFITARNKNIPIYVFISKQIITLLPVYLNNKQADYSSVVDNPEIFEFANEVRSGSGLWNFEFEKFQDIISILKTQLSYLFKESLSLRNRFFSNPDYDFHSRLTSKALKIILLKESVYEYEFLSQVLVDEISKYEMLNNDYEYKIVVKSGQTKLDNPAFLAWVVDRMSGLAPYTKNITNIVNVLIPKYMNEPGTPADLKGLYYAANTYARLYESLVNWSIEVLSLPVSEEQQVLRDIAAETTASAIKTVWNFPFQFKEQIADAQRRLLAGEPKVFFRMSIVIDIDEDVVKRYNKALRAFGRT